MKRTSSAWGQTVLVVLTVVASVAVASASCNEEVSWSKRFGMRGIDGWIRASLTWDDGTGPKVYVAGRFDRIDDIPYNGSATPGADNIVTWDGHRWNKVGGGIGLTDEDGSQWGANIVYDLAVFDPDGTAGPAPEELFAVGNFNWASGENIEYIARWDGLTWRPVGASGGNEISGTATYLNSVAVYDPQDGSGPMLYVSGIFEYAGSYEVNGIARWNGSEWLPVGDQFLIGSVGHKLAVFDDDGAGPNRPVLYFVGDFRQIPNGSGGFSPANSIAKWDGTSWSAVPGISADTVFPEIESVKPFDDGVHRSLWVHGRVAINGGPLQFQFVRLDGGVWSSVATDLRFQREGSLVEGAGPERSTPMNQVGGYMYLHGPLSAIEHLGYLESQVARWSPASPNVVENFASVLNVAGSSSDFSAVTYVGPFDVDVDGPVPASVIVGGNFRSVQQEGHTAIAVQHAAVFDGSNFKPLPSSSGVPDAENLGLNLDGRGDVTLLEALDPDGGGPEPETLFIGGHFWGAGSLVVNTGSAVRFNGTSYQSFDTIGNTPVDLETFNDGTGTHLYALTKPFDAGSSNDTVFRSNGTSLDVQHPFVSVEGPEDYYPVGSNLVKFNDGSGEALWLFGSFASVRNSNGVSIPANAVARFRPGTGWEAADAGLSPNSHLQHVTIYDPGTGPALFAFTPAHTATSRNFRLIQWTGTQWITVVTQAVGLFESVTGICSFDGSLYVAGLFSEFGNVSGTAGLAKWDGSTWSPVGGGLTSDVTGFRYPFSMVVHNDGSGPALYVSGYFTHAGGVPAKNLAKWDGLAWDLVLPDIQDDFNSLTWSVLGSYGGKLYVGGFFTAGVGGGSASGLISLGTQCPPCPADFNHSGSVTVQDIFDFLAAWFSGDDAADFNHVGGVTVQDIFDFLAGWFSGC